MDAGLRVGGKAKISYDKCNKLSNTKVCISVEAFAAAEYRRSGYRNNRPVGPIDNVSV